LKSDTPSSPTIISPKVDTVVLLSAYVRHPDDLETLMRFLWLAHALHVASIDPQGVDPEGDMAKVLKVEVGPEYGAVWGCGEG
jgi:hypothetical protein